MKHVLKPLGLLLLLLMAQQGAAVHELGHITGWNSAAAVRMDAGAVVDTSCTLCPAFAQAATAAFIHAFHVPLLGRAARQAQSEPQYSAIDTSVPRPRSRGPPSIS